MSDDKKLRPHPAIPQNTPDKPVLVIILDGWGEAPDDEYNGISRAETPFMDSLRKNKPDRWTLVHAHGKWVGLNESDMGNSEVGHNALGGGKITDQGSVLVDKAIKSKEIFTHDCWQNLEPSAKKGTLHLLGLLSDGGVHSRLDQLLPIMDGAAERGIKRIRLHLLTDGRDCTDGSSVKLMQVVVDKCGELEKKGCDAKVASGGGRMKVTMDRYESDWKIVKRGYDAHILGEADVKFKDPVEGLKKIKASKDGGKPVSDQLLPPFVIVDHNDSPVGAVQDGDAVIIFNFRADRVVEISKALEYEKFDKFERKRFPKMHFAGMMQYDGELKLPKKFLVPPPKIDFPTGEFLAANGVSLYASAESQKIGHVTFFWNGNRSGTFNDKLETYYEVPSDQDTPFNEKPAMKAREIADRGIEALKSGKYKNVRLNFANPDMVAHTGELDAAIEACTVVDKCVKELVQTVDELGGIWLVTADHGNVEEMVQRDKKGNPLIDDGRPVMLTSHTLNPIPVAIGGPGLPKTVKFRQDLKETGIASIGSTIVNLLGFELPDSKYNFEPTLLTSE